MAEWIEGAGKFEPLDKPADPPIDVVTELSEQKRAERQYPETALANYREGKEVW